MNPAIELRPSASIPQMQKTFPKAGWELYILHALMDEVHYKTINGQNVLTWSNI